MSNSVIDVGNQSSPQMVFFGVEYQARDISASPNTGCEAAGSWMREP